MLPLDFLLRRLESAGFRVSPADRLRVVQLLDTMGNECIENPQKLRLLLAPILARSAAEQAKFYEVFNQWMPLPHSSDDSKSSDESTKGNRRRWLFAALLFALSALGVWYFTRPPVPPVQAEVVAPNTIPDTTTLAAKPDSIPKNKTAEQAEILKPQLPIKELLLAKEQETPRPSWLAYTLLGLMTLAAAWMWWKWYKRPYPVAPESEKKKDTKLAAGLGEIADAPPYTIPFRGQEAYIRIGREQYRLADAMRQRQQGEHPYMDVPASVQATLDKGGFPTLRFRLRRQPADYLCVMEEKHRQSHLARLFRFFAEHIRGQDVALEIFNASSSLDRFWNAQYPGGLTLDQLQRLFPAHRLLVFGDAHALLDVAASGQARVRPEMSVAFRRWRQRLLLTPNAPATWTFEEKALYDLFVLFPATLQGMSDAAQYIEASIGVSADDDAPPTFSRWRERAQQHDPDPHDHRFTRWRDAADHEEYLAGRPDLLRWLRALAVYPTPTWEITLAIGQGLEKQGVTVRPDDLLVLSRIGWLQSGRMPSDLRDELLADLPQEAEAAARVAALAALEAARTETNNGFAGIELGVNVAIQEFALAPEDPEKQEAMRLLFEAGRVNKAQEQVADAALGRHLQRSNAKTSEVFKTSEVSISARDFVKKAPEEATESKPAKRAFFTRIFWMAFWLTLATLVLFFAFSWLERRPRNPGSSPMTDYFLMEKEKNGVVQRLLRWSVEPDSATIWNNRGVRAWNERRDTVAAFGWFAKSAPDEYGPSYSSSGKETSYFNLIKLGYNLVAENLNLQFDLLSLPPEDLRRYTVKPENYFGKAYQPNAIDSAILALNSLVAIEKVIPQDDALHALGLAHLYRFRRDSAVACYERLIKLDNTYFINLRSPRPNLETLLGMLSNRILNVETKTNAKGRLYGTVYFQLKDTPESPILLRAEMLDSRGKLLTQTTNPQRGAAKGLNQTTFVLPSDSKTPSFVADSLRITVLSAGKTNRVLAVWNSANRFVWRNSSIVNKAGNQDSVRMIGKWALKFDNKGVATSGTVEISPNGIMYSMMGNQINSSLWSVENGQFTEFRIRPTRSPEPIYRLSLGKMKWVNDNEFTIYFEQGDEIKKGNTFRFNRITALTDGTGTLDTITGPNSSRPDPLKPQCEELLKQADILFKAKQFQSALDKLEAAKSCDPSRKSEIENRVLEIFTAIENEKNNAIKSKNLADVLAQMQSNMTPIPGGTFTMGSRDKEARNDECPHKVTVQPFSISKYELTQAQWRAVMGSDPPELYNKGCDECPVEVVSWDDAQEFLNKLNALTGGQNRYRLPSEAEWEYVAKGGQYGIKYSYKYAGSDNLDEVAWYSGNYKEGNTFGERKTTRPVGGKKPNQLGVYDMSGNVWEWCQDTYGPYPCGKKTELRVPSAVLRGGSWDLNDLNSRVATRDWDNRNNRDSHYGFRLARGGEAGGK